MTATRRLFWEDTYARECDTFVIEELSVEGRPAVILDATCFYPTSGGQPHDLGTLNGTPVAEVIEGEDGRIVHVLASALHLGPAHGVIDWPRRFDHMQQHTGQHILSQAFEQLLDADTTSFHLGEESCTIDLTAPDLSPEQVAQVEDLANRIVMEDRAVTAREYDRAAIAALALRKAPQVEGSVRVVDVTGFDRCACGGTHVSSTGQIGAIHVRRGERRRGQMRVEFLCGWRALHDYRQRDVATRALAAHLTVGVDELADAVARIQEGEQQARHQAERLRKRLLDLELPRLAQEAEPVDGTRLLCRMLEDYDAGNMRYIAQCLVQQGDMLVLLGVNEPSPQVCFARGQGVAGDMAALMRAVMADRGGKGGGQPHIAQGGGIQAEDVVAVLQSARRLWLGLERREGGVTPCSER